MRRHGRDVPPVLAALLASLMLWSAATLAQATPETFAATATVKRAGASVSAPSAVTITRYSSDAERDAVMAAVRAGGSRRRCTARSAPRKTPASSSSATEKPRSSSSGSGRCRPDGW